MAQTSTAVTVGDKVKVTGTAQENAASPSFNQAVFTAPTVTVLSSGNALPSFTTLANATYSAAEAEKYEGMLVQFETPTMIRPREPPAPAPPT